MFILRQVRYLHGLPHPVALAGTMRDGDQEQDVLEKSQSPVLDAVPEGEQVMGMVVRAHRDRDPPPILPNIFRFETAFSACGSGFYGQLA